MNNNPISQFFAAIGDFLANLFGEIHWISPPWIKRFKKNARKNPHAIAFPLVSFAFLFIVLGFAYYWYKNLPQPSLVTALITAPKITPLTEEGLTPDSLIVDFGLKEAGEDATNFTPQSVAPLNQVDKDITTGITLYPDTPGVWRWENDSRLLFTPAKDWPAGQVYQIYFSKKAFTENTLLKSYQYRFATQPLAGTITELKYYQDPTDATRQQVVATLQFNFPIDPVSLENHLTLTLEALKNGALDKNAKHYPFSLSYDRYKRIAYLRSEPIPPAATPRYVRLTIDKGVLSASHSDEITQPHTKDLLLPDIKNYFKISAALTSIVRNEQDRPEQVLSIETSLGVTDEALKKAVHAYLLPENYPATANEPEKKQYQWQNPGEINNAILAQSTPVPLLAIPAEHHYATSHGFKFDAPSPRFIYLKIDKGLLGFGDYVLNNNYLAVLPVPEYPKEISFLHKGALLALTGEKKLSVLVRGLSAVKFDFARVLPENVNQLVTQTQGDFNNPYFINQSFNQQNISEIFSETQSINATDQAKQQYTAIDFTKYLSAETNTGGPRGLFLLQATGWDTENNTALDVRANRLILITDLGLIVKDNKDGSHDVFVESITEGTPQRDVNVSILGKNGLPLLTYATDELGRAHFPALTDYVDDREPTVYLAHLADDVSFIPYNNINRQLNVSRYDVGGIYTNNETLHSLSAYLFTDRGIYRPGDTAHIGMVVKQAFAHPQPAGLPLEAIVIDPRGIKVLDKKFTLDEVGFSAFDFPTLETAPTGQYAVSLYIVKDDNPESLLGSTYFEVAEFQPDTMRIKADFLPAPTAGWSGPTDLMAQVRLWNLYGAPAANRRISGRIVLEPKQVSFVEYADYVFADPLVDPKKPAKVFSDNLPDAKTDENGLAAFHLNLQRFSNATYQLTFFTEGFEADSGRSVATQTTALISPLPYLVGYKPDGDLQYVKQHSQRQINIIGINPQLKLQAINGLRLRLESLQPVSTLVKKPDGTYQYQSIIKNKILSIVPWSITDKGADYSLPTENIGHFLVSILDPNDTVLAQFNFSVVGAAQTALAKNAELAVTLERDHYKAGEEIELQITSPYTGSGLITIERDKVYAAQWFKADTTNSIQKIMIPADLQGNAYLNITFVRDWNSPDIFMSPMSYSVVPFAVDHDDQIIHITLDTPAIAQPGEPFKIAYQSDKPGKMIIFAIDEGILQVANYVTPDPLAFFFQKRALEVLTQQTVDQILPQFIHDRELSAVGGDASATALLARNLNPFKRKVSAPVAFWSGMIDTDNSLREVTYEIPDYFNGTLRVMAVAASLNALGRAEKKSEIRGHFVINPNAPLFVAPGDEFEFTASIANNVKDSGPNAKVSIHLQTSPELEIISANDPSLVIGEGKEEVVHFKLRATPNLGAATITIEARANDKSSTMDATLSVRPASDFFSTLTTGTSNDSTKTLPINRVLYPEYRTVEATLSSSPLILLVGLQRYLENFPYGCTEQLISKVFPLLAMTNQPWFIDDDGEIKKKIDDTIQMLGQRQMTSGAFSYWPGYGENKANDFATVYAVHFLTEAKAQGYPVPSDMLSAGLNYLTEWVASDPTDKEAAITKAYAIYVLTRNEIVTTNYLTHLQLYLEKDPAFVWQQSITGAYLAATYQLLKSDAEAKQLIEKYKPDASLSTSDFYTKNTANAQYLYLLAQHFPDQLPRLGTPLLMPLVNAMNTEEINTLFSSYASLALNSYAKFNQIPVGKGFSISEVLSNGQNKVLATIDNNYGKVDLDETAKQVSFNNPEKLTYFYQLTQAGFDKQLPTQSVQQGIEISREYRDSQGKVITHTTIGTEIEVHIRIRALDNTYLTNIVVVDLLPGGFEVIRNSVKADTMDYVDIREDRVNFYGSVYSDMKELIYRIKATNSGTFTIPLIFTGSLYNPKIEARSVAGLMTVSP